MLEVVILLMIYLTEYVFQTEDLYIHLVNKTPGINELKTLTKHHVTCQC